MMKHKWLYLSLFITAFFSLPTQASSINSLFHHASDPYAGNPKGDVTITEFFDYQCSHCINMASTMEQIIKANPNVRVVYKDFPIRGPISEYAARAALAANLQGKYASMSHALLNSLQPLSEESIDETAKNLGLHMDQFHKDMNSSTITNELKSTYTLAFNLKFNGTPAFVIGKTNAKNDNDLTYVLGEMSQNDMQNAIDKAK